MARVTVGLAHGLVPRRWMIPRRVIRAGLCLALALPFLALWVTLAATVAYWGSYAFARLLVLTMQGVSLILR